MRIYLSGALASAVNLEAACAQYDAIAIGLAAHGIETYVPHHSTHPRLHGQSTPFEVYETDSQRLLTCDAVLALLDAPSFGVGAEIALAVSNGRAVLGAVASQRAARVSRYIAGLLSTGVFPNLVTYEDVSSLVRAVAPLLLEEIPLRSTQGAGREESPALVLPGEACLSS